MNETRSADFDQSAKERCIEKAIALSRQSVRRDKSFIDVLRTQVGTISKLSWTAHIFIIFCISTVLYYGIYLHRSWIVSLFLVLLGPILQLVALPEVMISYRYKAWQMEQCTVITLAQLILVRIAIWQTLNFLYIMGLTIVLHSFVAMTELVIYIFIPYNLSNAIAFWILRYRRKNAASVMCVIVDFVFVIFYYGGLQGRWKDMLHGNLAISWGISLASLALSVAALYKNIACKKGMKYGFTN